MPQNLATFSIIAQRFGVTVQCRPVAWLRSIFNPLARRRLACRAASLVERRDDRVLRIWGDVPYWMIVDVEMDRFLAALDGSVALEQAMERARLGAAGRREVLKACEELLRAGVLAESGAATSHVGPGSSPEPIESIAINLTRRCNLRCSHCYALPWLEKQPENELSAEQWVALLEQVAPHCSPRAALIILGGEPLLEPGKLIALARWARGRGMSATVSTNGTGIDDEFARQARETGLEVQVSLDGPDAPSHDAIRGSGVFERAVAGIRRLTSHGARTILSTVVHRGNLARLEGFFDLALRLGVDEARFIPLKCIGGGSSGTVGPASLLEIIRHALELVHRRPELRGLMGRDVLSILAGACRYSYRRSSCGTGRQTVLLDADGSIYPCLNLNRPEFRLADVRQANFDFGTLWRSDALARLRECTAIDSAGHACRECAVRHWCLGGCRGETFAVTGKLNARSPGCEELRAAMIEMMWMLAQAPEMVRTTSFVC